MVTSGALGMQQAPHIDRKEAEGIFRELLGQKQSYRVFNIFGQNGRGKTAFVSHLISKYMENKKGALSLVVNFENRLLHKPNSAVMHIAKALESKYGVNFSALWKAYALLWQKRYEHSPILYAADLPYFNELKVLMQPRKRGGKVTIEKGLFDSRVANELEELRALDPKEVEAKLYQFFAADLRRIIKQKGLKSVVLFLENLDMLSDTEHASPCAKDEWVRNLITHLGKDVLVAITTQEPLNWASCNSTWKSVVTARELTPFSQKDALRFLSESGIKESSLKEAIVISSGAEPFLLNLASSAYQSSNYSLPATKGDIYDRFFAQLEEPLLDILKLLVHARFFTLTLIERAAKEFSLAIDSRLIKKLLAFRFVKSVGEEKYSIDQLFKDALIQRSKASEIIEYKVFLLSYYENILQSLDQAIVKRTPLLIDEAIEEAWYHLNSINSEPLVHFEWLDYYVDRFFMYAAWEPFLDRYRKIAPKLESASDEVSKMKLVNLYNNVAGLYESLGDTKLSKTYYNRVVALNRPQVLSA